MEDAEPFMKFDKLIIATGNAGKYREFLAIVNEAADFAREVIFAPEIAALVVDESGRTYAENAMLKARAWAAESGLPCLADDSGLEVSALGGAPGLYSARVIPGEDSGRVAWILSQLEGTADRRARFAASLALCVPDEYTLITEGCCYGTIAESPRGDNGFGYDPVFVPEGYTQTFAELSSHTKNLISHRTNAFRKIYAHFMR